MVGNEEEIAMAAKKAIQEYAEKAMKCLGIRSQDNDEIIEIATSMFNQAVNQLQEDHQKRNLNTKNREKCEATIKNCNLTLRYCYYLREKSLPPRNRQSL